MSGPYPAPDEKILYVYGAFDISKTPRELVLVGLSRRQVREAITWREDADNLRIRRGIWKPFNT